jgi:hypothetical protein
MLDKQIPTVHSNGINKDRLFQDKNDVTFALNSIRDNHEGGRQEYQSEPGNELSASIPFGYTLIGHIYGQNEEVYLLSGNNTLSEIGVYKQGFYETLANLDLGFSTEYPITGEYRVRNGCERIIYWGDGFNDDYWFNRDQPNDFKTSGVFDPNKFKFVPSVQVPKVDLVQVNSSGGNLPLGSYYFQLELVDVNENVIYKTDVTPQTIIYDEDQSDSFNNIDGGLNAPQYDPAIGGLPATNKSITLRFYNLDTSFDYIRVNVVRQIAGTQVIDAHAVGELIPISSSDFQWTYTGYNVNAGDFPLDYSSLVITDVRYKSSLVQEQVQGRLVRANVKQDQSDYSIFQSYASLITAQWVAKEVEVANQFDLGNPKNPNTYWDCTTFQGDEIYAFGIQYLLTNGDWTPVFHIPGRHTNATDPDTITVVANSTPSPLGFTEVWASDVEHLGLIVGDTLPRWKAFNTASITTSNTTTHPYDYIGEFGYYESDDVTYPDIQDCDGNYIWGLDPLNNQILPGTTKIRHHRFPDRRLIPHLTGANGEYIQPLGVKFDDITYPSVDVVGHRFCHAVRSANDKTVLDSGWFTKQYDDISLDYSPNSALTGILLSPLNTSVSAAIGPGMTTGQYGRYNSGDIVFNQKLYNPSYLRFNTANRFDYAEIASQATFDESGGGTIKADYAVTILDFFSDVPERTNYKVEANVFIPAYSVTTSILPIDIKSADFASPDSIIKVDYPIEDIDALVGAYSASKSDQYYVYKKVDIHPYDNLLNLTYNYIHFNPQSSTLSSDNVFYGGDSLITDAVITRVLEQPNYVFTVISYSMYEERSENFCLRHAGTGIASKYCKIDGDYNWLLDKIADIDTSGEYVVRALTERWPEYYAYNKDYDVQTTEQGKVSLPLNFNYCSDCLNEYPNRVIFSPKSFDEESFDLYRINKINDYIDLPAHRGRITGLSYQNNQLLVHTEDTTFILQPNPQQIATDQNTAYLTTGDFLSIPPQELIQTDIGFGGMQSKQSFCNTPFGHCWVDQKRGDVLLYDNKVQVLSNKGLTQWFKEYLPSEATKRFYEVEGKDFPIQSTLDSRGVGCIVYYDPRFKRLLISKKDYYPIDQRMEFDTGDPYITVWSFSGERWNKFGPSLVYSYNDTYFEDKSWTISYSFLDQSFTSWHSYIPYNAFSDSNNFYTLRLPTGIATHFPHGIYQHLSKTNYQKYFGTKYDFVIEWSNFDPVTSSVSNLYYVGYSQIWDSTNKRFKTVDTTFDRGMIYNFEQSTGLQTLILQDQHTDPYQNNNLAGDSKYVIKTDQNYKIAGLSDMSTAQPVVTEDWQARKLYSGYIDLVPSLTNINTNKSPYDWGNLWDKFTFVRLFYKPTEDHKKAVMLQVLNSEQSIR